MGCCCASNFRCILIYPLLFWREEPCAPLCGTLQAEFFLPPEWYFHNFVPVAKRQFFPCPFFFPPPEILCQTKLRPCPSRRFCLFWDFGYFFDRWSPRCLQLTPKTPTLPPYPRFSHGSSSPDTFEDPLSLILPVCFPPVPRY